MPKRRVERSLASAALLFAALGDPTRLTLLQRLSSGGPASISMLADTFPSMTRQGVTKHLQVLAAAGGIDGKRQGREQGWALNPQRVPEGRPEPGGIAPRRGDPPAPLQKAGRER